jgi:hypothetical protein
MSKSASSLSANTKGKTEEKKTMARRKLTLEEQLRGVRAALKSRRTPPQLKAGLERRKQSLEETLGKSSENRTRKRSFLDEEKDALKITFADLTSDTARTPLAASRFKKFTNKIGPVASSILQKIIETVLTEAAKKSIGL